MENQLSFRGTAYAISLTHLVRNGLLHDRRWMDVEICGRIFDGRGLESSRHLCHTEVPYMNHGLFLTVDGSMSFRESGCGLLLCVIQSNEEEDGLTWDDAGRV